MEFKLVGVDEETGEPIVIKAMTPAEILERQELNVKNTATAARQRVLEHLRKTNGADLNDNRVIFSAGHDPV